MSLTPKEAGSGAAKVFPHDIPYSARFDGVSDYLSFTPSVAGNLRRWTLSLWMKPCDKGGKLLEAGTTSSNREFVAYGSEGKIQYYAIVGGSGHGYKTSVPVLTDFTAWHHVVVYRDAAVLKMYVNGVEVEQVATGDLPDAEQSHRQVKWVR